MKTDYYGSKHTYEADWKQSPDIQIRKDSLHWA